MAIRILDTDELVRLLFKNEFRGNQIPISRQPDPITVGPKTFDIDATVVAKAIDADLLIPIDGDIADRYELNYPLIEESWLDEEDARIADVLRTLNQRYPAVADTFEYKGYRALVHPECANNDMRGFAFIDKLEHEYLVTQKGAVVHLVTSVTF